MKKLLILYLLLSGYNLQGMDKQYLELDAIRAQKDCEKSTATKGTIDYLIKALKYKKPKKLNLMINLFGPTINFQISSDFIETTKKLRPLKKYGITGYKGSLGHLLLWFIGKKHEQKGALNGPLHNFLNDSQCINLRDCYGCTLLHIAALRNTYLKTLLLLDTGFDVDAQTRHGLTPLHIALLAGNKETALELIKAGANLLLPTTHKGALFGFGYKALTTPLDLLSNTVVFDQNIISNIFTTYVNNQDTENISELFYALLERENLVINAHLTDFDDSAQQENPFKKNQNFKIKRIDKSSTTSEIDLSFSDAYMLDFEE